MPKPLRHKLGWLLLITSAAFFGRPAAAVAVGTDRPLSPQSEPKPKKQEPKPKKQEPKPKPEPKELLVILEGKPIKDHNLKAIRQLVATEALAVTVFVSPTYFLSGDEASAAKLSDFLSEHKGTVKVGVHLSGQRILVENSGVSFRAAPTFWGYPLDVIDCHELCGIEVPLLGYSPKEQNAIIKTAVKTLNAHIGQPIRHSIIEGGLFTKSVAARLRHNGITVDHTLAGKSTKDFYDIRHFPLYSWLDKIGTLARVASPAPSCVIHLAQPSGEDGCRSDQPVATVKHLYHSEAFLLTRGASILLSH